MTIVIVAVLAGLAGAGWQAWLASGQERRLVTRLTESHHEATRMVVGAFETALRVLMAHAESPAPAGRVVAGAPPVEAQATEAAERETADIIAHLAGDLERSTGADPETARAEAKRILSELDAPFPTPAHFAANPEDT